MLPMKRKGKVNQMKKTILIIAIVSTLLVVLAAGCRAVERVPGATAMQSAVQSVMPTLPGVSPSPAYTLTTPNPAATTGATTTP